MPTPTEAGTEQEFTVKDLEPTTTYYFSVKAIDEAGNISKKSNVVHLNMAKAEKIPSDLKDDKDIDPAASSSAAGGCSCSVCK